MIPTPKETKSVGKPTKNLKSNKKSQNLSSSQKRRVTKKQDTTSLNTQEKKKKNKKDMTGSLDVDSMIMKSC